MVFGVPLLSTNRLLWHVNNETSVEVAPCDVVVSAADGEVKTVVPAVVLVV